jgi:16S rRNA (cytidine1402-2'-O)-methyltransferase
VLARELTKLHEEFWRGTLAEAEQHYQTQEPYGEFTLVIAGGQPATLILSEAALKTELQELLRQGMSRSQASRQLAAQTRLPRRELYQLALSLEDIPIDREENEEWNDFPQRGTASHRDSVSGNISKNISPGSLGS